MISVAVAADILSGAEVAPLSTIAGRVLHCDFLSLLGETDLDLAIDDAAHHVSVGKGLTTITKGTGPTPASGRNGNGNDKHILVPFFVRFG